MAVGHQSPMASTSCCGLTATGQGCYRPGGRCWHGRGEEIRLVALDLGGPHRLPGHRLHRVLDALWQPVLSAEAKAVDRRHPLKSAAFEGRAWPGASRNRPTRCSPPTTALRFAVTRPRSKPASRKPGPAKAATAAPSVGSPATSSGKRCGDADAMTAPVHLWEEDSASMLAFTMPSKHALDALPHLGMQGFTC